MSCYEVKGLLPLEEAMNRLLEKVSLQSSTEQVTLSEASGRILAVDAISKVNVPPHHNSSMDGYAIRAADQDKAPLKLTGQSFAGHPFVDAVGEGECVRIMTGAVLPAGADSVVMQENTDVVDNQLTVTKTVSAGENVRRCGEDIAKGHVVLKKGRRITASDVGLLASLGEQKVTVYKAVTAAVFSTGDELKPPGSVLSDGEIYESNGVTVASLLKKMGVNVIEMGIIPDEQDALRTAFEQANQQADVVISSGGVSVGDADFVKDILAEKGVVELWKLAIKPGKPFAFGTLSDSYFIGLPGNPVSALVTLHQLAVPALAKMGGEVLPQRIRIPATLQTRLNKRPGRTDFQRGIYTFEDGKAVVSKTGNQGSGILSSMSQANCYIVLPQDSGSVEAGETVTVELFDYLLS